MGKKEAPVKTLVGEMPPEKNNSDEITKDEPSSSGTKVRGTVRLS